MKKLAIFDLDGTLLNTIEDLGTAVNHALASNGFPQHSIPMYNQMVGNGVKKLIERALPPENRNDATIATMLESFRTYYDTHLYDFTAPYPGIEQALASLRSHDIAVAVASNKYESAVRRLIAHFFRDIEFVAVCGQIEGVPTKPDPSIVFRILSDHPTPKNEVVYIGDSGVDMETARRAGVECIGVTWGFRPARELVAAYADHIAADADQMLDLILPDR